MRCTLAAVTVLLTGLLTGLSMPSARGDDAGRLAELIDHHIEARLDAEGVRPAAVADDAEFLRRVFLDLHGVVPPAERTVRFLGDRSAGKRGRLIDELLASERFGRHFGDVWRGYLLSPLMSEQRAQSERFTDWLADRFNENDGWNRVVSELLTATGTMDENPAVTYLIEGRHPLGVTDLADLSSRYFLGVRLNCAQCHDHPFVEWTQKDYWGMAAFFTEIQTPGRPKMVYRVGVQDDPRITLATLQETDALDGFQSRPPTFLGGEEFQPGAGTPRRVALARWMTSPENPYFARAMVNRLWWHFFGRGLVDPVDDMHSGNPPSHPELLDRLARRFAESGFDVKLLCRAIVSSRAYQRTSRTTGPTDPETADTGPEPGKPEPGKPEPGKPEPGKPEPGKPEPGKPEPGKPEPGKPELFERMAVKVLTPAQLYDSLVAVLGPPGRSRGIDTRFGARYEFCQFFAGDGDAEPTRYGRGIPHLLRLMNSPQFAGQSVEALAARVAPPGRPADEAVEELFLTILSRRPTSAERALARGHREAVESASVAYRELAWVLLMSSEFSLNR